MKFYARDYVRRIYVVQFPMPRFFFIFTYVTLTYTHVAIASVFKKVELSSTFSRLSAVTQRFTQSYFLISSHDTTYHVENHFVLNRPSIYMGKDSDVEALLIEKVRTFPAIIYRTDYRTKLHEHNSERKRPASGHVGFEPAIREGRLKSLFYLMMSFGSIYKMPLGHIHAFLLLAGGTKCFFGSHVGRVKQQDIYIKMLIIFSQRKNNLLFHSSNMAANNTLCLPT